MREDVGPITPPYLSRTIYYVVASSEPAFKKISRSGRDSEKSIRRRIARDEGKREAMAWKSRSEIKGASAKENSISAEGLGLAEKEEEEEVEWKRSRHKSDGHPKVPRNTKQKKDRASPFHSHRPSSSPAKDLRAADYFPII